MGFAESARRRSPPPTPSAIAAITARLGGSGRRRNRRCAPISLRSACASAGSPPTRRRSRRWRPIRERLRHEGEGLLLIYDNAIDATSLRPYLPPGGAARVLVTSNAPAWRGVAAPVEIRLSGRKTSARTTSLPAPGRDSERADAEALSEALGGLPLAHEQAAAYCERLERFARRISQALRGRARAAARRRQRRAGRISRRTDGREGVRPRHRGSRQTASRRRTADRPRRAARARTDPAVPVLRGAGEIRRAAGVSACGRRARRGGCGAAGFCARRSRDDRRRARSGDRDRDDPAASAGAGSRGGRAARRGGRGEQGGF